MDPKKISYALIKGVYDSFRGMVTLFYLDRELNERNSMRQSPTRTNSSVRRKHLNSKENTPIRQLKKHEQSNVIKKFLLGAGLNGGIYLLSILLYEYAFTSIAKTVLGNYIWSYMELILLCIFKIFWDIADSAFRHSRGRPVSSQSASTLAADIIFSTMTQIFFLIQAVAVSYFPIGVIGNAASFLHMCILYSLYAFEYKWYNMDWPLHQRLTFIEMNWPYFIGFGLPMAVVTSLSNSWIISGCIFSILFPLFIISGNEANPVTGSTEIDLHFFSPVIELSNIILNKAVTKPQRRGSTQSVQVQK